MCLTGAQTHYQAHQGRKAQSITHLFVIFPDITRTKKLGDNDLKTMDLFNKKYCANKLEILGGQGLATSSPTLTFLKGSLANLFAPNRIGNAGANSDNLACIDFQPGGAVTKGNNSWILV